MDDDLTDEQIEQLLANAAARLQQQDVSNDITKRNDCSTFNFPKLSVGKLEQPYISTKGHVSTVDGKRLLEEKQRRQADRTRKVEDPVTTKKMALEVSPHVRSTAWPILMKFIPKISLSGVRAPSWLPFCIMRVLILYHSYSEETPISCRSHAYVSRQVLTIT